MAKPIPDGYGTVTPHLIIEGASDAIDFYRKAFGAEEIGRMPSPDGKLMHAEIKIGSSRLMVADAFPDWGAKGPKALGGSPTVLHLYVEDVDSVHERAVSAGAKDTMPVQDTFWGDRYGKVTDPFGHEWSIATRKEDLSPEEIQVRAAKQFGQS